MSGTNGTVQQILVHEIQPDPDQPRKQFDQSALQELARSIEKNGLLQPITVRRNPVVAPGMTPWIIIAGERRFRASIMLQQETVDALVYEGDRALELQLVENLNREDLNPMEIAEAYQRYLDAGHTVEDLAESIGRPRSTITKLLNLTRCLDQIQHLIRTGSVTQLMGESLGRLSANGQMRVIRMMNGTVLTVYEVQKLCERVFAEESQAPMFPDDPPLTPEEVQARRTCASAFESACRAFGKVDAMEKANPGITGRAIVDRLDITFEQLDTLERAVRRLRSSLGRRRVKQLC